MSKIATVDDVDSLSKALANNDLICVHVSAQWAPECAELDSVLELLAEEFKDITFLCGEAEKIESFCVSKNINSVPTCLFYKFGDLYSRVEGFNVPEVKGQCTKLSNFAGLSPIRTGELMSNGRAAGDQPNTQSPDEAFKDYLSKLINKAPMMIFIKGSPAEPRCGFSKQLVEILSQYKGCKYDYYDILQNEKVRQGLKTFSNWQTYPQVYVNGELIGGIDIIKELHETGELESSLPKSQSVEERIKSLLSQNDIILFMKGSPAEPRCKFSRALMEMFKELPQSIRFETFDILQDDEIRQGLKEYSNWPTYPQLYVKGELIGGLDIIKELHESGELVDTMTVK